MIGLLGSGSWATAIVKILLENEERIINWWVRESEVVEGLLSEHHNPSYLSEAFIDTARIHISSNIREVIESSDDIFVVVPSAFVSKALQSVPPELLMGRNFHSAVKGVIPETNQIVTEYLHSALNISYDNLTVVSGPSHAEETARQKLTYLTVASSNKTLANRVREMLGCYYVKTVYSTDMQGIEYSTVMKNIYAVAVGICHGLGYGDNLIAVMISNAVQEYEAFIQHFVPMETRRLEQFAYLGDLLVTCYSQFSRNRTFGQMIGYGYNVKAAQLEMKMIAEGYYAVNGVEHMRSAMGLEMPIEQAVYKILYGNADPRRTMKKVLEHLK